MPSKGSRTYKYVGDPKTGKSVAEHRLVAERKLGRKLRKGEDVDHKDGNEKNNAPSNIVVVPAKENRSKGGKHGASVTNRKRRKRGNG